MNALAIELWRRQAVLCAFAALMLLAAVPALLAGAVDARTLREVGVWTKPLKFMLSTALFAATTAWFVGLLPPAVRAGSTVRLLVWTLVGTSLFEVAYITWQAAQGEASHYNVADPWHAALFGLMALAAVGLTATQAALACLIARHAAQPWPAATLAVVVGLVLTFVLSTASGFMLGARQPPAGIGLPLAGWHLGGPDLRPAHFLGVHAQQLLPLAGLALRRWARAHARPGVAAVALVYVLAWGWLSALGWAA